VAYPIVDLQAARIRVVDFVTGLEEVMLRTAPNWGIAAERNSANRGIWVGPRKMGSIGIAVRRGISFHGLH
jgi:lipoate-protein ligase B